MQTGDLEKREEDATRVFRDTKELKDVATKRQKDGWSERCQRCVTKSATIEDKREKMDEAKAYYKRAGAKYRRKYHEIYKKLLRKVRDFDRYCCKNEQFFRYCSELASIAEHHPNICG